MKRMEPHVDRSIKDLPGEIWRDVPEFEDYYKASNLGRIKSVDRISCIGRRVRGRVKAQQIGVRYNCINVQLSRDGIDTTHQVGVLILTSFGILPQSAELVCMHIDKAIFNNRLENLKWATQSESIQRNWELNIPSPNPMIWRTEEKLAYEEEYDVTKRSRACIKCLIEKSNDEFEIIHGVTRRTCKQCVSISRGYEYGKLKRISSLRESGLKQCKECNQVKPLTDFYKNRRSYVARCKRCFNEK